jgi:ApaG protein
MPALQETVTNGIRVSATGFYVPGESVPAEGRYLFGYRVEITNEGNAAVTLRRRHWIIIDGEGTEEEVRGDGVVGQQPRLAPGEGFKYTSYCPLTTEWGTMEGTYEFETDTGERMAAKIGRFYLGVNKRET